MSLPNLHVATFSAPPTHKALDRLKTMCRHYGVRLHVLGSDQWVGFGDKLQNQHKLLKTLPDEDLFMFMDAWDVLVFACPSELIKAYQSFEANIVFTAEKQCFPDRTRATEYRRIQGHEIKHTLPYLNSGFFVGPVKALRHILDENVYELTTDDQRYYTSAYLSKKYGIVLDHEGHLCASLHGVPEYYVQKAQFRSHPCPVLHFNGWAKAHLLDRVWNEWNQHRGGRIHALRSGDPNVSAGIIGGSSSTNTAQITLAVFISLAIVVIIVVVAVVFTQRK